jgi:uncharacterized protein (DUF1501 family)
MKNRRNFLKSAIHTSTLSMLGTTGFFSNINALYAKETLPYKAIVCVFMPGGQDHYDTILPYDQPSYDQFSNYRSELFSNYANQKMRLYNNLLKLNPINSDEYGSREFALPNEMQGLKSLFDDGHAAIIGNVGPLIQPVTRTQLESNNPPPLPLTLNSHNDQKSTWLSLSPEGARHGWGGRFLDIMNTRGVNKNHSFSGINANYNNVFLAGKSTHQFVLSETGKPTKIEGFDDRFLLDGASQEAYKKLKNLYQHLNNNQKMQQNASIIKSDLSTLHNRSFLLNKIYRDALKTSGKIKTPFPDNYFCRQLKNVSNSIKIREQLGVQRQIFYVEMDNFDTHSEQVNLMPKLQKMYSDGIVAFFKSMKSLGLENDVTLFTSSDFGRTLGANGDGTDHGWGGHHFIVGGAVNGNKIHGHIPESSTKSQFYTDSHGTLFTEYSIEQYAATLGKWFGLSDSEIRMAIPSLIRFSKKDLGFMKT